MKDLTHNLTHNLTHHERVDRAIDPAIDEFPADFWVGVAQFNAGEFYACHDTLEAIWIQAPEADKRFYQGILQVAVGLYHLGNQNFRGAVMLLGEGSNRLHAYPSDYAQLDLHNFLQQVVELLAQLQTRPPQSLDPIPPDRPKLHRHPDYPGPVLVSPLY